MLIKTIQLAKTEQLSEDVTVVKEVTKIYLFGFILIYLKERCYQI